MTLDNIIAWPGSRATKDRMLAGTGSQKMSDNNLDFRSTPWIGHQFPNKDVKKCLNLVFLPPNLSSH